jgi:hypothetical protein
LQPRIERAQQAGSDTASRFFVRKSLIIGEKRDTPIRFAGPEQASPGRGRQARKPLRINGH